MNPSGNEMDMGKKIKGIVTSRQRHTHTRVTELRCSMRDECAPLLCVRPLRDEGTRALFRLNLKDRHSQSITTLNIYEYPGIV